MSNLTEGIDWRSTQQGLHRNAAELASLASAILKKIWDKYKAYEKIEEEVAATGLHLLGEYGSVEDGRLVYRAENYKIEAGKEPGTYIISEPDGKEGELGKQLMLFKVDQKDEIQVQSSSMIDRQKGEFLKVSATLRQLELNISSDPRKRLKQLEGLAPQGDRLKVEQLKNEEISKDVEFLINNLSSSESKSAVVNGARFQFVRQENGVISVIDREKQTEETGTENEWQAGVVFRDESAIGGSISSRLDSIDKLQITRGVKELREYYTDYFKTVLPPEKKQEAATSKGFERDSMID